MHVSRSLSGRNAESTQVHGLHSGVGGNQLHPRLARKAQRGTAVPSRIRTCTYTPLCTVWRWCIEVWVKRQTNFRV